MQFVKRKATTIVKFMVQYFEELKRQFLMDFEAVVFIEDIPDDVIVNWDRTGLNYVPVSMVG